MIPLPGWHRYHWEKWPKLFGFINCSEGFVWQNWGLENLNNPCFVAKKVGFTPTWSDAALEIKGSVFGSKTKTPLLNPAGTWITRQKPPKREVEPSLTIPTTTSPRTPWKTTVLAQKRGLQPKMDMITARFLSCDSDSNLLGQTWTDSVWQSKACDHIDWTDVEVFGVIFWAWSWLRKVYKL